VVLVGTTASGKSRAAQRAALLVPGTEIVSVDSMGVYRELDIATAKPSLEDRQDVPHHLIDLVDPADEFTVSMFKCAATSALATIGARAGLPLLVGGTGLYVRAVVDDLALPGRWPEVAAALEAEADRRGVAALHGRLAELDPLAATRMTPENRRRVVRALEVTIGSGRPFSSYGPGLDAYPPTSFVLLGLPFDAESVDRRIEERLHSWVAAGLLEEVRALAARPAGLSRTARQALGYRELLEHVEAGTPLDEAVHRAIQRTRAFARRQWAWFRRDPRISWLAPGEDPVPALVDALEALGRLGEGGAVRE
jgi:tRNA dimethylallyltransferase